MTTESETEVVETETQTTEDDSVQVTEPETVAENSESESQEESETDGDENSTEKSENSDEETKAKEDKPAKKSAEKRINQLTREKHDARRDAEYWKGKAQESKNEPQKTTEETAKDPNEGRPRADDFETQEEYLEKLTDWKVDNRLSAEKETRQMEAAKKTQIESATKWQTNVKKFSDENPDFNDVMESAESVELSQNLSNAIMDSDLGPAVIYELAKNPEEAIRISQLSPNQALKEIGKLEGKIEASLESSSSTETETKKITKAPKPLTPVSGGGGKVTKNIYDPNISQAEYEQFRNEQIKKSG